MEPVFAAAIALKRGIPCVGGLSFAGPAFGCISDTSPESLAMSYRPMAQNVRDQIHLEPPPLNEFRQQYRKMYGGDIAGNRQFVLRTDVGDTARHGQQSIVSMMTRDRHLLGFIEQQLADRYSVLVVYGGSHWATLSGALEERPGKPKVRPFLE